MNIITQTPSNLQTNVARNVFFRVQFDAAIDRSTVTSLTVIVIERDTDEPVDGVVDYIYPTNTITFQLTSYLKANTTYKVILIGGPSGIYGNDPHDPFMPGSYSFQFTTGEVIDPNLALAGNARYDDGPAFQGAAGIYKETFDRTGATVSHIVTTSAQVGPSGTIIPAPWGAERYIQPSGVVIDADVFELLAVNPEDGKFDVIPADIVFTFTDGVQSVGTIEVSAEDLLGADRSTYEVVSNYTVSVSGQSVTVHPTIDGGFADSTLFTVVVNDIVSQRGVTIESVQTQFRTRVVPAYTTIPLIRNLGPMLGMFSDDEILKLIYENSLWIYETVGTFEVDDPPKAAKDYVACKTKLDLIYTKNLAGGQATRKTLTDMSIEYGSSLAPIVGKVVATLESCVNKNLATLNIQGLYVSPTSVVMAKDDPNFPIGTTNWRRLPSKDFT